MISDLQYHRSGNWFFCFFDEMAERKETRKEKKTLNKGVENELDNYSFCLIFFLQTHRKKVGSQVDSCSLLITLVNTIHAENIVRKTANLISTCVKMYITVMVWSLERMNQVDVTNTKCAVNKIYECELNDFQWHFFRCAICLFQSI